MPEQYGFSIRGMRAEFYEILETSLAGSWISLLSFLVNSQQKTEHYKWLGMAPAMRQWLAGRQPQGLRDEAYSLENLKFEATVDFEKDDLRRGLGPQIRVRIQEMAEFAGRDHWEFLGSGAIALGHAALCYDGVPFFNAAHPGSNKVAAQKNLLTAAEVPDLNVAVAARPTPYEFARAVLGCIGYLYGIKSDQGLPMNGAARSFLVMVPVSLWAPAVGPAFVNQADPATGMADNPLAAAAVKMGISIMTVVNPYLDWTTDFAVFRTDGRAKPLIRQDEYDVNVSMKGEGSEYEHDTGRNQFGCDASRNVGYGFWQHAQKATFSHS